MIAAIFVLGINCKKENSRRSQGELIDYGHVSSLNLSYSSHMLYRNGQIFLVQMMEYGK